VIVMTVALKLLLLSLLVFVAAFAAERLLVPNVMPIAWSDEPQSLWAVEGAFMLRSVEITAAIVAAIALAAAAFCGLRRTLGAGTQG
jgi:hypothetical protein